MPTVEHTGKRNLHYSRRHRRYGAYLTMMDFDSVEYDGKTKQPLAFIETKFGQQKVIDLQDHRLQVMCNTALLAGKEKELPVFVLVYYPLDQNNCLLDADRDHEELAHMQYFAVPVNDAARKILPEPAMLSERQWVNILRTIHNDIPSTNTFIFDNIVKIKPPTIA